MRFLLSSLLAALLLACALSSQVSEARGLPPTQIAWQRSLADAKKLADATNRPLFVAINMDGESASERIVRENYRDPAFVELTRDCVCVVGSLFRHSPRDYDEFGRRIPCPKLGVVTCGEHMALEPVLFSELAGERVAPRHVFIRQNGEKVFDESLLFDIRELDRMLADASRESDAATPVQVDESRFDFVSNVPNASARERLESRVAVAREAARIRGELEAIRRTGDAAWGDALVVVMHRIGALSAVRPGMDGVLDRLLIQSAREIGATDALISAARRQLTRVDRMPVASRLPLQRRDDARMLALLLALDPTNVQARSWQLGRRVVADVASVPFEDDAAVAEAIGARALQFELILKLADEVRRNESTLPRPSPIPDTLPSIDDLIAQLEELDRLDASPEVEGAMAKATLDLARQKMTTGSSDVPLLLEDAARKFERALAAEPERVEWWIEASRTAYYRSDFQKEADFGRRALAVILGDAAGGAIPGEASLDADSKALQDEMAVEALRWIGDAEARLAATRGDAPRAEQATGLLAAFRCLGLVAASPYGRAKDWIGFVSLLESYGLVRTALEANLCAAERYPADGSVRQSLRSILWSVGRVDLEPAAARRVQKSHPDNAVAAWFTGYAYLVAAEDLRRADDPNAAVVAYAQAEMAFSEAMQIDPGLESSCRHYIGVSWHGSGMAHLLAVRQPEAADALAFAARAGASIRVAVDGLQRDAFDLVDQCLEWRAGRPSPVDAIALLDRIEAADPDTAFWAGAVSDTMLREGLRSDGKNPQKVMRDTVDAAGDPVRIPLGLPTSLGDAYFADAVIAGRRAIDDDDADKKPLAQALTIIAERELQRLENQDLEPEEVEQRIVKVRDALLEAAPLYGVAEPSESAGRPELEAKAAELRALLGPARPRFREGR